MIGKPLERAEDHRHNRTMEVLKKQNPEPARTKTPIGIPFEIHFGARFGAGC
jgi:hypothetical protein